MALVPEKTPMMSWQVPSPGSETYWRSSAKSVQAPGDWVQEAGLGSAHPSRRQGGPQPYIPTTITSSTRVNPPLDPGGAGDFRWTLRGDPIISRPGLQRTSAGTPEPHPPARAVFVWTGMTLRNMPHW